MKSSVTLKVTLASDEVADLLSALEKAVWLAGEFASDDEFRDVGQLDWLIGEFKDQVDGRGRVRNAVPK